MPKGYQDGRPDWRDSAGRIQGFGGTGPFDPGPHKEFPPKSVEEAQSPKQPPKAKIIEDDGQ